MGDFPERTAMNSRYRGLTQAASSELERPLLRVLDELNKSLKSEREEHYRYVFSSLTRAMQAKDAELYRHSRRVQQYAYQLARTLDLSEGELETIKLAAFFHDIGKIGIHDLVLNKPARLTPLEYEYVKEHATRGALILTHSHVLRHLAPLVRTHHEQWDGSGYPFGLRGEAIPLGARIISIADAFEAMTVNRVYQAARTPLQALEELVRCAGMFQSTGKALAPTRRLRIGQQLGYNVQQIGQFKRLSEQIDAAFPQCLEGKCGQRADENDRDAAYRFDLLHAIIELQPVHDGQHIIQQDQRGAKLMCRRQCQVAFRNPDRLVVRILRNDLL